MPILSPQGQPISTAEKGDVTAFRLSTRWNPDTGRGTVKVAIPVSEALLQKVCTGVADALSAQLASSAEDLPDLTQRVLRSILPNMAVELLPNEARLLGMQLLQESERSVCDAVFMRCMVSGGAEIGDAAQLLQEFSRTTRADHAVAFEMAMKAKRQQSQLDALAGNTESEVQ